MWVAIIQQPAWFSSSNREALGAITSYVETSPREGFRFCNPTGIVAELKESGRRLLDPGLFAVCDHGKRYGDFFSHTLTASDHHVKSEELLLPGKRRLEMHRCEQFKLIYFEVR